MQDTDRTPDFYEIDVPADRPGVAMRRHLKKLSDAERVQGTGAELFPSPFFCVVNGQQFLSYRKDIISIHLKVILYFIRFYLQSRIYRAILRFDELLQIQHEISGNRVFLFSGAHNEII